MKNEVPRSELKFLGKMLVVLGQLNPLEPRDGAVAKHVEPGVTVEYGRYLAVDVSHCAGCHTERDIRTGEYVGERFAGGFRMPDEKQPGRVFVTPNITTGGYIKGWSEEIFISRIRAGRGEMKNSPMPWEPLNHYTDDELRAIYAYLQTVPPSSNDPGPTIQPE